MALFPVGPKSHQIQDHGRQPSCIILNGHISETVHPVLFVFGSSLGYKYRRK